MTAYLMILIGLLACASGLALSFRGSNASSPVPHAADLAPVALRALLGVYTIDLVLQIWQVDGTPPPWGVAMLGALTKGAIFWLLALYIGTLTGPATVPRTVSALTLALIGLGLGRIVVRLMPNFAARPTVYFLMSLLWLAAALALAVAVAMAARRSIGRGSPVRAGRGTAGLRWAVAVAWWSYVIAAIMLLRALLAPLLTRMPVVTAALDTPLVDTLLIVVFVVLGLATGGLGQPAARTRPSPEVKDNTAERRARLLRRADAALDRDFADPTLTIHRLAAIAGCSEHQLSAALNQTRGMNYFAYLNERRIRAAMAMMTARGMTATEIAYACGYNSRSTFYAAFKSVTGQSPGEWRAGMADTAGRLS